MPKSRLDGLPDAALRNVVRQLSSAQARANLQNYVDGSDALATVQLKRSISVAAHVLFTRVFIGGCRRRDWESMVGTVFLDRFDFQDLVSVLSEWMDCAGAVLKSL